MISFIVNSLCELKVAIKIAVTSTAHLWESPLNSFSPTAFSQISVAISWTSNDNPIKTETFFFIIFFSFLSFD
jgi:hypothetical protein